MEGRRGAVGKSQTTIFAPGVGAYIFGLKAAAEDATSQHGQNYLEDLKNN